MTLLRRIVGILVLVCLCYLPPPSAHAADQGTAISEIEVPVSEQEEVAVIFRNLGAGTDYSRIQLEPNVDHPVSTEHELFTYNPNAGVIAFNRLAFSEATRTSKNRAVEEFVSEVKASKLSLQTQQYLFDRISDGDSDMSRMLIPLVSTTTSADLFTAFGWINPAVPIIRGVLGVVTFVLTLFWTFSTIADLLFIGLPWAREKVYNGGKIWFVSADAKFVIREIETSLGNDEGYKNGYLLYFKRRVFAYIVLALCISYIVLGGLGDIISAILHLF
ncbi:hypothetical protein SD70_19260 [Gordoniibacillus kamchatkensis]|uniref:Uncharacterized protein n=1 Tax=Gordoniibacillus kamchatkensis TaxID=1590651 RepID=A0ABR5AEV3_9BACL|nr:hypothetical protein [Paenibacillus sp. VKM B-2647]KIL39544.1 hypothetical protein SD70_19260 [Paenibacillus sp. VKM B-2647]